MAKEQIVGVYFQSKDSGLNLDKEYLYKDTIGCKVGDVVVVEARAILAIAKVAAIYAAVSEDKTSERPMRNVVSKVESSYTREKQKAADRQKRLAELERQIHFKLNEFGWHEIARAVARSSVHMDALFREYEALYQEECNEHAD